MTNERRLGMLAAARIAMRHARSMAGGEAVRKGRLTKMRRAGKNMRSGENRDIAQSEARMWGYFLDRRFMAEAIARDIRKAARVTAGKQGEGA